MTCIVMPIAPEAEKAGQPEAPVRNLSLALKVWTGIALGEVGSSRHK